MVVHTLKRLRSVAFAFGLLAGLAAMAADLKAYVGNFKDSTVSVVDIASGRVLATLAVAAGPDGMVATPDGASVYVAGSGGTAVSVIDAAQDRVVRTIEVGSGPQGLAVVSGGRQVLVAVNGDDRIGFIDVASGTVTGTVPVPKPHTIAVRADGARADVASQQPGHFAVLVVDLAARQVVNRIALDKPPRDLEFSHDGTAIYLTLAGVPALQVIDPAQDRIVAQVPTGVSPHVAQHFAGMAQGVAVVQGPGELELFDPATRALVRSIPVGRQPHWMDITPDARLMAVSNEGDNTLSLVDLASGDARTVPVGSAPRKVVVRHVSTHDAKNGAGEVVVSIANFAFMPMELAITQGQTVRWSNDDGAPHGLAFKDGAPGESLLLPGKSFSRRFDQPGSYDYVCSVHPYMTARVVVRPR
jgi:YVTN family beta-propeller protein